MNYAKQYLRVNQTLDYLQFKSGFQYSFDDLKELVFLNKIKCYFMGKFDATPYYKKDFNPFDYFSQIQGVFSIGTFNFDLTDDTLLNFTGVITVEEIISQMVYFAPKLTTDYFKVGDYIWLCKAKEFDDGMHFIQSMDDLEGIKSIEKEKVYFKKSELDALFDTQDDSLQIENAQLKARIAELEQKGKPNKTTVQGDDLLILGAVMDILASEKVVPYTQTLLIEKIVKKFGKISGLSESTLTKKFAQSKDYIRKENEILL